MKWFRTQKSSVPTKPSYVEVPIPEIALRRELRITSRHMPVFNRAFRAFVRNFYSTATLERMLAVYNDPLSTVEEVVREVPWFDPNNSESLRRWSLGAEGLRQEYGKIIVDAAQAEANEHGWPLRFRVRKAEEAEVGIELSPEAAVWMERQSAELVKEISNKQREALRAQLFDLFADGKRLAGKEFTSYIADNVGLLDRERQWADNFYDRQIAAGASPTVANKNTNRYRRKLLKARANRIARTETQFAYSRGLDESWNSAKSEGLIPEDTLQEWIEVPGSERTCKICRQLGNPNGDGTGQKVPIGQPFISEFIGPVFAPPAHPHCLPGDALVLASSVTAKSERSYQGDMVVIRTASGNALTCTPNHPVLSDGGWKAARLIQVGGHVVSATRPDRVTPGVVDDQNHAPPVVQEIADFSPVAIAPSSREMPVAAQDFHGDGEGSEVAVVRTYRDLRREFHAPLSEKTIEGLFQPGPQTSSSLPTSRLLDQSGYRDFGASYSRVRGAGQSQTLCRTHAALAHEHARASAPGSNPRVKQALSDDVATHAERLSQSLLADPAPVLLDDVADIQNQHLGFDAKLDPGLPQNPLKPKRADTEGFAQSLLADPALVFADEVLSVDVFSFHGPVFNLETGSGAYIAQGVVTHNCRCTRLIVFDDDF